MSNDKRGYGWRRGTVRPGKRYGRWTVIRHAVPGKRDGAKARVVVQCVCGRERLAYSKDLYQGRSRGCASADCRHRYKASVELRGRIDTAITQALSEHAADPELGELIQRRIDAALEDYLEGIS